MEEIFSRGWAELVARNSGPFHLRFILQPLMATIFAIRSGLKDAHEGRPVFFWTILGEPAKWRFLMLQAWKDVGKLFLVAVALDVVYQIMILRWFYPMQTFIVATALAIVPYLVFRGLANRLRRRMRPKKPQE